MTSPVDYSLYLVTDSSPEILGFGDLCDVVEEAIKGGVTVVQLREKHGDTADLIRLAKKLHQVTKNHGIPLIVNDRVDVAVAAGVEGVHIGQDDIDISTARRLLGHGKIIGVTASSVDEAFAAARAGADYLGIGTVYSTATKKDAKSIIGPSGVRDIADALSQSESSSVRDIAMVCIGGISAEIIEDVLYEVNKSPKRLDGVAVVSAIISNQSPYNAAKALKQKIQLFKSKAIVDDSTSSNQAIAKIVANISKTNPLCHNMTNLVVQNFAANVALAVGASPIMSNNGAEAIDLAALNGSLVVNMGTVTQEGLENYLKAIHAYKEAGGPILFDPVGAGATHARREAVAALVDKNYFDVIKGNEGEIKTVAGDLFEGPSQQQRGVDSGSTTLSLETKVDLVRRIARREDCVVVMTGAVDVLSDGKKVVSVHNGHSYLGEITGSGCTLGTSIAAFMVNNQHQLLFATLAGLLVFEIAAENAAAREDVRGPGTFVPAFIDELYAIRNDTEANWIKKAKIKWH